MAQAQKLPQYHYDDKEFTFLDTSRRILEELKCGICLQLLSKPVATNCDHFFCGKCISNQHTCPACCLKITRITPDKSASRILKACRVNCSHSSEGCKWEGELGDAEEHLETKCPYVTVECPQCCGQALKRISLSEHLEDCNQKERPVTCLHCQYKCTHTELLLEHFTRCTEFPLPCPAGCGDGATRRKRKHMEGHLSSDCSEELISCKYAILGCDQPLRRKESKDHLANETVHLEKSLDSQMVFIALLSDLFQHPMHPLRPNVTTLPLSFRPWLQNSPTCYPRPPWIVKLEGFEEKKRTGNRWCSQPVYSHFGGYKMSLCVYANGVGLGKGTHVSIFAHLMRGDNDVILKIPFNGTITASLLNQLGPRNHHSLALWSPGKTDVSNAGQRLVDREQGMGWGQPQFMSHSTVSCTYTPQIAYLKGDCLFACIDRFDP